MKKIAALLLTVSIVFSQAFAYDLKAEAKKISILKESYPDVSFTEEIDSKQNDWKITVRVPGRSEAKVFYWAGGSMLPLEELSNKEKYWSLLYSYSSELLDPATFTEEQKKALKEFSSSSNRKNGAGTPMFFFDYLYDSYTQTSLEKQLVTISFLGKNARVHQRMKAPLAQVEKRIQEEAKTNSEVSKFVASIKSNDAYYWRIIAGTTRKSFHSLGIAVDILPVSYSGLEIYWAWAQQKNPEGWMLTPLSKRWMPPAKVIEIFEEEGFIWGGKWVIWDNMHFEYHPELINYNLKS